MTKLNLFIIGVIAMLLILGIFIFNNYSEKEILRKENMEGVIGTEQRGTWKDIELKDIGTGNKFKISDFKERPVLLESFAVWCPKCLKQQQEIKELSQKLGDSFIAISLDTDPNEDEARVRTHIENNGFDWYYAVSPSEMTKLLINEFGTSIISAPSTPIILICSNGSFRKLADGIKSSNVLEAEINKCE